MGMNATPSLPPATAPDDAAQAGGLVADAAQAVTLLYQVNALGLVRLAYVMIGTGTPPRTSSKRHSGACTGGGASYPIRTSRCHTCGRAC
jgi:hypothetical protein